uniref:Uncharacterized protein n=1 Tax=Arundo donax TaxID=35708 RepID=A0A0A9EG50_ARUDO
MVLAAVSIKFFNQSLTHNLSNTISSLFCRISKTTSNRKYYSIISKDVMSN